MRGELCVDIWICVFQRSFYGQNKDQMEVALFLCFRQSVHKLLRHMSVEKDRGKKKRKREFDRGMVK